MELAPIQCKTCGHTFSGRYCNNCGEKVYNSHDKSVLHFLEEIFHFIIHLDGTLFRTIKTMFVKPGQLSKDYCDGIRKPYFKPLSLFLLLVIIYLLFPAFEGLNMQLKYYMQNRFFGNLASQHVKDIMQQESLTQEELSVIFHQKAEKISKFLLLIIIPLTALFYWPFTYKKRKYFFDQMVFSTEINNMFLLWGFLLLPLLLTAFNKSYYFLTGFYPHMSEGLVLIIMYGVLCFYVAVAARKFYQVKRVPAVALGLLFFAVYLIAVQFVYKFILFAIVINQIH